LTHPVITETGIIATQNTLSQPFTPRMKPRALYRGPHISDHAYRPCSTRPPLRDLNLVHVVDPMQRETVTPDQTYYRLHGTSGSRHTHSEDELRRLRDLVVRRQSPYVLFNNLPRVGDAERFLALL
jgi:uncharacterized protein YecE (DUF72 family)